MPFTFAHPAAVLPIHSRWARFLNFPALVIGSISPDLGFFLPVDVPRKLSHSWWGILEFNLPFGLLISIIFFKLLYQPSVFITPNFILKRLEFRPEMPSIAPMVYSILIGSATHVLWDSFTHQGTWFTNLFPSLTHTIFEVSNFKIQTIRIFQHMSTLFGTVFILYTIKKWMKNNPLVNEYESYLHTAVFKRILILCIASPLVMAIFKKSFSNLEQLSQFFSIFIFSFLEISLAVYLVYTIWWHIDLRVKAITKRKR